MKVFKEISKEVIEALKAGGVFIYPTETCYGLGGDATNSEVVEKIYKIKQRREKKPFLVLVPDVAMAMEYLEWSDKLDDIASKHWPGPLTVVAGALSLRGGAKATTKQSKSSDNEIASLRFALCKLPRNDGLAVGVVAPDGTVAMRVTAHPVAAALAQALGRPLISTSANISGQEPSYSAKEVIQMFENQKYQPDILIDAGELPKNLPTTMVRVVDGEVEILRQGGIEIL